MAKTARIKWPPQKWRVEASLSQDRLDKKIQFDWWVVIDVDYIIVKEFFFFFYNLANLFTAQKRLELGGQLPKRGIHLIETM